jgi:GGDEF domain-containing protein
MGVSLFPRDGDDIGTLMQHADHAMYEAKSAGKNCYSFDVVD